MGRFGAGKELWDDGWRPWGELEAKERLMDITTDPSQPTARYHTPPLKPCRALQVLVETRVGCTVSWMPFTFPKHIAMEGAIRRPSP